MADKQPTIIEPVAADVKTIMLILENGIVTSIEASVAVRISDDSIIYQPVRDSNKSDPSDYSEAVQEGLTAIASEAAAKFAAAEGF